MSDWKDFEMKLSLTVEWTITSNDFGWHVNEKNSLADKSVHFNCLRDQGEALMIVGDRQQLLERTLAEKPKELLDDLPILSKREAIAMPRGNATPNSEIPSQVVTLPEGSPARGREG